MSALRVVTRRSIVPRIVLLTAALALLASGSLGLPSIVEAQDRVAVEGTADFRNPPTLGPGSYSDRMVSGESIWYGVLYTNDVEFRFAVSFADPIAAADTDLSLEVGLIGPTLGQAGLADPVIIGTASYNDGTTNLWYLEVRLESDGVLGIEYDIHLDVEGVEENKISDCTTDPNCDLDEQLAGVEEDILDVETRIGELEGAESVDVVQGEIDDLTDDISDGNVAIDRQNDEIALLCEPETDCTDLPELPATTPSWAVALGGLLLVVGLGALAAKLLRKG